MIDTASRRSLGSGLLSLLRPPNVFTAVADALAGLLLARQGMIEIRDPGLWCLAASACLYLGGMALNDYFDREVDAVERPERPIPSGVVPPLLAAGLGLALLGVGMAFASLAGPNAETVGAFLALAILLYDAMLKGTALGFLNMGICRGLNFFMPLSTIAGSSPLVAAPVWLAVYISVLTYLSRDEVSGNSAERARRGILAMALVGVGIAVTLLGWRSPPVGWLFCAALLVCGVRLFAPLRGGAGGAAATGRAIGGGILLIPLLDATFVAAAGQPLGALAVGALALPAIGLRRVYSPT